ncbi:MAG TPA: ABC transporter substrate-binding protein [Acetobacteraceae bacterium]|nr:ABC transporter substrate-binding protein [Acetobacteraceae bacterium]
MTRTLVRIGLAMTFLVFAATGRAEQASAPVPGKTYRVGFSQIVDHPALNATRQGFLDGLRDSGFVEGKNLAFEYQNAQGDVGNARNIAEKFVADGVDLLAPCTTPNTQATIKVARGTKIPVVFGCVTNPVDAGILQTTDAPTGTNITGVYGSQPAAELVDLIKEIVPNVKAIGTIYNGAEANSIIANRLAKAEATKLGLKWVEVQIASSAEVKTGVESLVGRVDAILTPQDNTLASAFDPVVKTARDNKLGLFSLDTTSVPRGALASFGVDQYKSGVAWAKLGAVPVLLGQDPATMMPVPYKTYDLYLNAATAKADGIAIPDALQRAHKVYEQ